ncbi:ImmA/IrrE family metallo-endopeptidase [Tersicoccus sp. Bi-70]|uniref:ImmA/IrrE family metallo-endopeptidase n=1 Tax=Tersicoccus sp. Bi-70 TaxID=1897634 RepID=UPI0009FAF874|nr:ImmA/IrrE family metallo-endopeptidase [Tersicoccus sp. Bi-70]
MEASKLMTTPNRIDDDPRWASAPGDTIRRILDSRGQRSEQLADGLGIRLVEAQQLIDGQTEITGDLAVALARFVGSTPNFWLVRDSSYRESLAWLDADSLVQRSPIADMVGKGWLEATSGWKSQARALLSFYDVRDAAEWTAKWAPRLSETHFRSSKAFKSEDLSVAAWLRQVERGASQISVSRWDPSRLRSLLPELRHLSKLSDISKSLSVAQSLIASSGVALQLFPAPAGNRLSGAAFVLESGQRVIGLTGRHLAEDHLWFTLFHEIAHLLLHSNEDSFLDILDPGEGESNVEDEANTFARNALIPTGLTRFRETRPTMRRVLAFAAAEGVAPGVVVGQLHHEGILQYNQLRRLIRRYHWDDSTLKT